MASNADTQTVMEHHLRAVGSVNLAEIMRDYAEHSAIHTAQASYRGLKEIQGFFEEFLPKMPPTFDANFVLKRQVVDGDIAYIVWSSEPEYLLGTDTYLIRGGKIVAQMFTAYLST